MSWKPEVIADSGGVWTGNALRFATKEESDAYASDLSSRWTLVREYRSVEDSSQPNYRWENGRTVHITSEERERAAEIAQTQRYEKQRRQDYET